MCGQTCLVFGVKYEVTKPQNVTGRQENVSTVYFCMDSGPMCYLSRSQAIMAPFTIFTCITVLIVHAPDFIFNM